jgi:histidyl-tRNA synthetase
MLINLNPQRGLRDLYPESKARQDYIFTQLKKVADLHGFLAYDGPLLEDINLYLNKSSQELIAKQTFQVIAKNKDQQLVLRPEMTPSLSRMIANKAQALTFPLKLFNWGLRYRYEAPQKGRAREFYQADFDIIGSDNLLADAEILYTVVNLFLQFGAKKQDFILYLNCRNLMEEKLRLLGIKTDLNTLFKIIDKKEKIPPEKFPLLLAEINLNPKQISKLEAFLNNKSFLQNSPYFQSLFSLLKNYGIDQYCEINPSIVRGLDYYTGLVFEVKETAGLKRSLLGGGRYDNLIAAYNHKLTLPGIGFATSDVVLEEFLCNKNLFPANLNLQKKILVTVFTQEFLPHSIKAVAFLREKGIAAEIFLEPTKKLDKQLKWANKNNFAYALIIGPEEIKCKNYQLKNLRTRQQQVVNNLDVLVKYLKTNLSIQR